LAEEAPRLPRWSMKMEQRNNICALACVHHMRCQLRFRNSFRAPRRRNRTAATARGWPDESLRNLKTREPHSSLVRRQLILGLRSIGYCCRKTQLRSRCVGQ
jgi:hypothetical protein